MFKAMRLAMASLAIAALATAALAAPKPDGVWRITSDRDGQPVALIRLQTVAGGSLTGVLTASLRGADPNRICVKCPGARRGQRIIGMELLWGLIPDPTDPLKYDGGSILDPGSGNIYGASMVESPDGRTLTVRGFLGLSLLGRTQTWTRAAAP